jgi:hypothetical protein
MSVSLAVPAALARQGDLHIVLDSHRQRQQLCVLLADLLVILNILPESEIGRRPPVSLWHGRLAPVQPHLPEAVVRYGRLGSVH